MTTRRTELETVLTADDQASKVIEDVAKDAEALDKQDPEVEVTAETSGVRDDLRQLQEDMRAASKVTL